MEKLKLLCSEVYLDFSYMIYGVHIDSSLMEVFIDYSFRKYNQYKINSLILCLTYKPSKENENLCIALTSIKYSTYRLTTIVSHDKGNNKCHIDSQSHS